MALFGQTLYKRMVQGILPKLRRRTEVNKGTFRQKALIAAMQGLLMNPKYTEWSAEQLVKLAVVCADALVEANTVDEPEEPRIL